MEIDGNYKDAKDKLDNPFIQPNCTSKNIDKVAMDSMVCTFKIYG
jgi:hypothetical protein